MDHLGFGLSEKPPKADYGPQGHVRRLGGLLDRLGLEDVTLVVHDYGGPIGLAWAMDNLPRVRNLVVFNTWMWSLADNAVARRLAKIYSSPWNRWYYARLPAGPKFFLPTLIADAHTMSRRALAQYLLPFEQVGERRAPYDLAAALFPRAPGSTPSGPAGAPGRQARPPHLGRAGLLARADDLDRWKEALPKHRVLRIEGARNFVPEDASLLSTGAIRAFLDGRSDPPPRE